jgi:hypothetical protein
MPRVMTPKASWVIHYNYDIASADNIFLYVNMTSTLQRIIILQLQQKRASLHAET